jgi:hypothetical protein
VGEKDVPAGGTLNYLSERSKPRMHQAFSANSGLPQSSSSSRPCIWLLLLRARPHRRLLFLPMKAPMHGFNKPMFVCWTRLGDVINTVRSMPKTAEKGRRYRGIGSWRFRTATAWLYQHTLRTVTVTCEVAEKNVEQFLRPLDVQDVPPPGPGGWVAGQSAIVLRAKTNTIDSRALALQLRSSFG